MLGWNKPRVAHPDVLGEGTDDPPRRLFPHKPYCLKPWSTVLLSLAARVTF